MSIVLTRYLYFLDECYYSLLFAITNKHTFNEVVFWASEIYFSGFKKGLIEFIWKLYYDFYAIQYPKYERKIEAKTKDLQQSNDFKDCLYLLNLLYYSKVDHEVFLKRMLHAKAPSCHYIGRSPSWLKDMCIEYDLTKKEQRYLRSINKNKMQNILYYIYIIKKGQEQRIYNITVAYFKKIRGLPLTPKSLDSISYKNKKHIIIALICYLNKDEHLIQKKLILKKFSFDMGSVMRHHAEPCKRLRKTLTFKRNYSINHLIGLFSLKRNLHKDYKDIMRQQWEFYAFQSPIWQNRFNRFHAKPNMYSRQMDFINDDMLEEFYENYNYEPDEESLETQEKSIIDIDEAKGIKWILKKFHEFDIDILGNKGVIMKRVY